LLFRLCLVNDNYLPHSRIASRNDDSPNKMVLSKQELFMLRPEQGKVIERSQVVGLHHHYLRQTV
jgi:hypothetical protein